jgi:hypothetical protein
MILAVQIEELSSYSKTLIPLIDQYQKGEPDFADNTLKWLEESEKMMSRLRLPEGSEMSALRSRIIRTGQVSISERTLSRSNLRKARNVAAAEALERAEVIIRSRRIKAEERLNFFEEKLCEGMTALLLKQPLLQMEENYTKWLDRIWNKLNEEPSTRPLALYIAASMTPYDRSIILNLVLDRVTQEGLEHQVPPD